jgi:putative transposase
MGATLSSLYKGHRYPVEIISHCVWLYHTRFTTWNEIVGLPTAA